MEGYATAIQCDPEYSGRNAESFIKYEEDTANIEESVKSEPVKEKKLDYGILTSDRNDPRLKEGQKNETGQHDIYLVLSDEERSKGFIRPVRNSYVHVGKKPNWKEVHRMLDEDERAESKKEYPNRDEYVAVMTVLVDRHGKFAGGTYVTQKELDAWESGKLLGGCGTLTTMGNVLSETYARDPKFYGATFCCGCNKHLPVDEFVWDGTNETVGS